MLSRVRLSGGYRDALDLWLGEPTASGGSFLKNIEGIGPYEVSVYTTEWAMLAGGVYDNSSPTKRNVVLTVGFEPDWGSNETVADLRHELYLAAPPGREIIIRLYNSSGFDKLIEGVVETNEPNIFTEDPEVQISIICNQPIFREPLQNSTTVDVTNGSVLTIDYEGTEPCGFFAEIRPGSIDVQYVQIRHEEDSVSPGRPGLRVRDDFLTLNRVQINTRPGRRDLRRHHSNGDLIRRLFDNYSVYDDAWPMLYPGRNRLRLTTGADAGVSTGTLNYLRLFSGF